MTRSAPTTARPLLPGSSLPDADQLDAQLRERLAAVSAEERQATAVEILRETYWQAHEALAGQIRAHPAAIRTTIRSYTRLADMILRAAYDIATRDLCPNGAPTAGEQLALLCVGGSGRAEMAPYSDLDILFVVPCKTTPWCERVIESILYILWDLRLKIGHAVRTVDECITAAQKDVTIHTNLMEGRHLAGEAALSRELTRRLRSEVTTPGLAGFVEAKLAERDERHDKQGGSRYLLEPNVKEGKGGLRDLQTLYWIARAVYDTADTERLVAQGVFTPEEGAIFDSAEDFLWMSRCLMHIVAGRATEKLTFDLQVELAALLGYTDSDGQRGVERFMQSYFRHAKEVGELTRLFLVDLETKHVATPTPLGDLLHNTLRFARTDLPAGYRRVNGRLAVNDPDIFLADPVNFLRIFKESLSSGLLVHPQTMRLVTGNLHLIDDTLRADPEANRVFLDLLLGDDNPERILRRMNELGVLGAFIPEFGRIECMMQFNMYHHYTVDEHTIRCISALSEIEAGGVVEDLPVASRIIAEGLNRKVLFIALLLHDIGKGLPEAHEIVGARIAEEVAPRLGLSSQDSDTVVWLVRHHLVMSDTAQKRDIADPRTTRDFAALVGSAERLDLLLVLTVCDIRGVGPGTWNNWKAMLLRELYRLTRDRLTERSEAPDRTRDALIARARAAFAEISPLKGAALQGELERHFAPFWITLGTNTQLLLSDLSRGIDGAEIRSDIRIDESRDATRACFAMADHPGIFARMAGALALSGANVIDARTFTSADGIATSVFYIQDHSRGPYDESRLDRLRANVARALSGALKTSQAIAKRAITPRRERKFKVPTQIRFDNTGSELFTIIEVDTRDRLGLLHDLTRCIHNQNLTISSAMIATYGNQAVDSFYVTDLVGRKLYEEERQRSIDAALRAAIEAHEDNI